MDKALPWLALGLVAYLVLKPSLQVTGFGTGQAGGMLPNGTNPYRQPTEAEQAGTVISSIGAFLAGAGKATDSIVSAFSGSYS